MCHNVAVLFLTGNIALTVLIDGAILIAFFQRYHLAVRVPAGGSYVAYGGALGERLVVGKLCSTVYRVGVWT